MQYRVHSIGAALQYQQQRSDQSESGDAIQHAVIPSAPNTRAHCATLQRGWQRERWCSTTWHAP
jgi:hypothetical protein